MVGLSSSLVSEGQLSRLLSSLALLLSFSAVAAFHLDCFVSGGGGGYGGGGYLEMTVLTAT